MQRTLPLSRAIQTLTDPETTQTALMAWLEMVEGRTPEGATICPVNGQDDDDRRFILYVWCDHDLIGAAIGTEVFRGGEWLLTTCDITTSWWIHDSTDGDAALQRQHRAGIRLTRPSKTKLYALLAEGKLQGKKHGRRTMVMMDGV